MRNLAELAGIGVGSDNGSTVDCKVGRHLTEPRREFKRFVRAAILPPINLCAIDSPRDRLIVTLFVEEHRTQRQIGAAVGLSSAGVCKVLQRLGIPREAGTWIASTCLQCGAAIEIERAQFRRHPDRRFCSLECNWAWRECEKFVGSRAGMRKARKVAGYYIDLLPGYVVHHHDHDQTHNDPSNLAVFATDSIHHKFHHGNPDAQPLWDGRSLRIEAVA